ncbi:MAG: GntR family transcriptional regulator [Acidobacteria bacterium]|nr:GntR family transcriptional regulator [Acidobacteriota bacterium]
MTDSTLRFKKNLDARCTSPHNTPVIPFRVAFQPGVSLYEQIVFAAKRAILAGQLRPGDPFPSVRALGKELKINPNTAHKVIGQLTTEGFLTVQPGVGTVVALPPEAPRSARKTLLDADLEQLAVTAIQAGIEFEEVVEALRRQWNRIEKGVATKR